jgi:chemotaxis protein methyltransferase CheR
MTVSLLSAADFALITSVLGRHSGIAFGPDTKSVLERRILKRVGALGLDSFNGYARFIEDLPPHHPEIQNAIEQVTIKETYFLRESLQVSAYVDQISARKDMYRPRPDLSGLSIWSAGCSTGEEVYSIAMMLAESHVVDLRSIRIIGSDISNQAIEVARKAVYGASSFRAMPADLKNRYFIKQPDGDLVRDVLRATTRFVRSNIIERDPLNILGQFDAIFCRNVLIYFGEATRQTALDIFYENLVPGGILCLGHSESLLRATTQFEAFSTTAGIIYRKPGRPSEGSSVPTTQTTKGRR